MQSYVVAYVEVEIYKQWLWLGSSFVEQEAAASHSYDAQGIH